jgi:hypothetical protein
MQATFLLHLITRQGCLRACGRIQAANALNLGTPQPWEATGGAILEETGEKRSYQVTP